MKKLFLVVALFVLFVNFSHAEYLLTPQDATLVESVANKLMSFTETKRKSIVVLFNRYIDNGASERMNAILRNIFDRLYNVHHEPLYEKSYVYSNLVAHFSEKFPIPNQGERCYSTANFGTAEKICYDGEIPTPTNLSDLVVSSVEKESYDPQKKEMRVRITIQNLTDKTAKYFHNTIYYMPFKSMYVSSQVNISHIKQTLGNPYVMIIAGNQEIDERKSKSYLFNTNNKGDDMLYGGRGLQHLVKESSALQSNFAGDIKEVFGGIRYFTMTKEYIDNSNLPNQKLFEILPNGKMSFSMSVSLSDSAVEEYNRNGKIKLLTLFNYMFKWDGAGYLESNYNNNYLEVIVQ